MTVVNWSLLVLFIVATAAVNAYVVFYLFRPWRTTGVGRALMIGSWGDLALLNLSALSLIFGDHVAFAVIGIAGMALFAVGRCYLLWTLLLSPGAKAFPPWSWRR